MITSSYVYNFKKKEKKERIGRMKKRVYLGVKWEANWLWNLDLLGLIMVGKELIARNDDNLKLRVEFWGCRLNTWDVNFSCSVTTLAAGLSHSSAAVDFWCDAVVKDRTICTQENSMHIIMNTAVEFHRVLGKIQYDIYQGICS